jgi:hypothetical protein
LSNNLPNLNQYKDNFQLIDNFNEAIEIKNR